HRDRGVPPPPALCKWLRRAKAASVSVPASGGLLLQQRRNERVLENVQRFVQVCARMFCCDARAETDPILRDSWIIHRRDPETAAPKFVPEPIHELAIANDDRHHVSYRCLRVESNLVELSMEVIGVLPKFGAQFRLSRPELERFENRGDHDGRQRARVYVRMRVKAQILQRLPGTGDETAQCSERF